MKKLIFFFAVTLAVLQLNAQNVGINTTSPQAALDINGDLLIRNAPLTLVNGANDDINTTSAKFSHYTISGPTSVFEIGGLTGGIDGRMITLYNSSPFLMIIKHQSIGSLAINQIHTGIGIDFTLSSYSSVTFRYQALDNLWHIVSSHNEWVTGGGGSSYWTASGNDIYNNNLARVGIGTTFPSYKLDINGDVRTVNTPIAAGSSPYLTSGGALIVSNTTNPKFIIMDGSSIQGETGFAATNGSTFSPLALNPFGGNIITGGNLGIRTSTPNASLSVARGTGADGTAAFFGTQHVSHFNFGTTEETFIRSGKTGSGVAINDSHNGNVNIAGGGGYVAVGHNNPATRLDVQGGVRISQSASNLGTIFKQLQAGNALVGPGGSSGITYTINFPFTFTTVPHLVVTPRQQFATLNDNFTVSINDVTNTSAIISIYRIDRTSIEILGATIPFLNYASWSQQLEVDWMAFTYQ
jgi:hypothetical protein